MNCTEIEHKPLQWDQEMTAWASAWCRKLIEEIMYEMEIIDMLHYEL
jgi:hypothetical protein